MLPLSAGGPDAFDNMLLACGACNHHRQSTDALEWLEGCEDRGLAANRPVVLAGVERARNLFALV